MLFGFQIVFLLLTSNLILIREHTSYNVNPLLYIDFVLWLKIWYTQVNVLCVFEIYMYSAIVGWSVL